MATKYKLRQAARSDLKSIGRYRLKHHGKIQRDRYLAGLKERFELLADNPHFGRPRGEIKTDYHCSDYGKHAVFYLIQKEYVEIVAILRESMMPERHF